ncbi:MAG: hypothetical protein ACREIV_01015, partial [Planctomycetaceae bacterium]
MSEPAAGQSSGALPAKFPFRQAPPSFDPPTIVKPPPGEGSPLQVGLFGEGGSGVSASNGHGSPSASVWHR